MKLSIGSCCKAKDQLWKKIKQPWGQEDHIEYTRQFSDTKTNREVNFVEPIKLDTSANTSQKFLQTSKDHRHLARFSAWENLFSAWENWW